MRDDIKIVVDQLGQINTMLSEMKEDIRTIKNDAYATKTKMDFLAEGHVKLKGYLFEVLMLRADKVSLEFKLIELQSSIRKIQEFLRNNLKVENSIE